MGFSKIKNVSLTELFVQQVENMILSGELAVGEQLPSARELSARMGVSRPVISAGLIELEKLGFVEIQTPILCASSPEGARDYIVPSRKYKGSISKMQRRN